MPELLLELFSEEIPARMQARAAADLARSVTDALAPLAPEGVATFHGPRRIALVATVRPAVPEQRTAERGPRLKAPDAAVDGFLRKHGALRDDLTQEGDHWVLNKLAPAQDASALIAAVLPGVLWGFPWPKSMRWGRSAFTWVRPLRRILCVLAGVVVPFSLAQGEDDGHGLVSGNETEGHRFHAPGAFAVHGFTDWEEGLRARRVIPEAGERRRLVAEGIERLAAEHQLHVVPDDGLLDEVAGLVEWPVPLLGRIDAGFMDLPPEVMQVSMRVNQRYFALRHTDGSPAPFFAFAANIEADDAGQAIVAGNERVLRARFSDARHFWDLDRRTKLADRVAALDNITFHARLGTQGDRVKRIAALAERIARDVHADPMLAASAAKLSKADLTTGMVGEFPELQGVMGGYYARHDGADPRVVDAVRDHYLPKGPSDRVPSEPVAVAVALADKLDQLVSFFRIAEGPTGSGDPYGLRRAGLGIIRIIRENGLYIPLAHILKDRHHAVIHEVENFLLGRLRVMLRSEGLSHDVVEAALNGRHRRDRFDILDAVRRAEAIGNFLQRPAGQDLITTYRRASNIVAAENKFDGPHEPYPPHGHDLDDSAEYQALSFAVRGANRSVSDRLAFQEYETAMTTLSDLRPMVDEFLANVRVNDSDPAIRSKRLRLLATVVRIMDAAADFSRIEG